MGTKLILAGLITALAMAGTATAKPSRTVAVGKVQGTEAYLAVTYDGHRLRAYACNGSARRLPTISAWFDAPWDGRGPITVKSGGHTLELDGPTSGRLDGHRIELEPATGPAGLYEETSGHDDRDLDRARQRRDPGHDDPDEAAQAVLRGHHRERRDDRRLPLSQPTCGPPSWARRVAISVRTSPT